MAEFRWVLFVFGILILAVVFWLGRREARGQRFSTPAFLRRGLPGLGSEDSGSTGLAASPGRDIPAAHPEYVVTVRVVAHGQSAFDGERLILALRDAGLRHGQFGIFHRQDPQGESRTLFSVASLVEPGSFDLARAKTETYPGVSLFLVLPGPPDCVAAFDDMLTTARTLARDLDGELLDEQGSRLSVQRERYLREEVIEFQHKIAAP